MRTGLIVTSLLSLLLVGLAASATGRTWVVDDDEGDWADHRYIQNCVENATDGDVIRVHSGEYEGVVSIDRTLTVVGNGTGSRLISRSFVSAITVLAEDCVLTDLSVDGLTGWLGYSGIRVWDSRRTVLRNLSLDNLGFGIQLDNCSDVSVIDCEFEGGTYGVYAMLSNSCDISGIETDTTYAGLVTFFCSDLNIDDFEMTTRSGPSILLKSTNDTVLSHGTVANDVWGTIGVSGSRRITFTNVSLINTSIEIDGDEMEHWDSHDIGPSNDVNGNPIAYWIDRAGGTVPDGAAQVILVNCTDVQTSGNTIEGSGYGLTLAFSNDNRIVDVDCTAYDGFHLYRSDRNHIHNCTIETKGSRILLEMSDNNTISGNSLKRTEFYGPNIELVSSCDNRIELNDITGGTYGVSVTDGSEDCRIENNTIHECRNQGIHVIASNGTWIGYNTINDVIEDYSKDCGVSIENANHTFVVGNDIINCWGGMILDEMTYSTVRNNHIVDSEYAGIRMWSSSNNEITYNYLGNNSYYGLYISHDSGHNVLHHNMFMDNGDGSEPQARDECGLNEWDDGSYGNIWSDWNGTGAYEIGGGIAVDRHPSGWSEPEDPEPFPFLQILIATQIAVIVVLAIILFQKSKKGGRNGQRRTRSRPKRGPPPPMIIRPGRNRPEK